MSEQYRRPRVVPDRIIGPNDHPIVWYVTLMATGTVMWAAVFFAAWRLFRR